MVTIVTALLPQQLAHTRSPHALTHLRTKPLLCSKESYERHIAVVSAVEKYIVGKAVGDAPTLPKLTPRFVRLTPDRRT